VRKTLTLTAQFSLAKWFLPGWVRWYFDGTEVGEALAGVDDASLSEAIAASLITPDEPEAYEGWLDLWGEAVAHRAGRLSSSEPR
jgi:hypothetical protein